MATILVIDDEESILVTLRLALAMDGYTVLTALNGKETAHAVKSNKVDLVIADLFMPDKEGLETIAELRGVYPNLPIIAISGGGGEHKNMLLGLARNLGANATLAKPFKLDELRYTVRELLESCPK